MNTEVQPLRGVDYFYRDTIHYLREHDQAFNKLGFREQTKILRQLQQAYTEVKNIFDGTV